MERACRQPADYLHVCARYDQYGGPPDGMYGFEENDIYPLEVCLLNEACGMATRSSTRRSGSRLCVSWTSPSGWPRRGRYRPRGRCVEDSAKLHPLGARRSFSRAIRSTRDVAAAASMSGLGDDFAGLDEFGSDGSKGGPRLRKLEAKDGVSAMDQLANALRELRKGLSSSATDDDGNQQVSKLEFAALPVLGITILSRGRRGAADEFDADCSSRSITRKLAKQSRVGLTEGIELDAALQAGAMGKIETERTQGFELRLGLNENASKVFGTSLDIVEGDNASIIDQLMRALGAPGVMARVIDIFRAWDDDGSGTVFKREFGRALPMLGLHVDKKQAGELFDVFDDDQSGSIDYAEINKKLRKRVGKVDRKPKLLPKINKGVNRDEKSGAVSAARYQQVKNALAEELTTKRQLQRLKNQVARMERQRPKRGIAARADLGAASRKEIDRRVGRDLLERIQSVPMVSQEEMVSLC